MKSLFVGPALLAVLATGCTGNIGEQTPVDPVKDHVVAFQFTSPIGTGQLGRTTVVDGCVTDEGCEAQEVGVMSVTIDRADVLTSMVTAGVSKFDVTAVGPGTANISVLAQNTGIEATQGAMIQVLAPDKFELQPHATLVRAGKPAVNLLRTCTAPLRIEVNAPVSFMYKLLSTDIALLGSGFYPWTSDQLTEVASADPGADGGIIRYAAGPNATDSSITSLLGPEIPFTLIDAYDTLLLTDQVKAPTTEQERLIYAEVQTGGESVCFDNVTRVIRSDTPTVCTVVDGREAASQFKGPGPYQLSWLGAGPCTVTFEVPGTLLTVTREYLPLP